MESHPYLNLENTRLWLVLEKALADLQTNRDIQITTAPQYVIGYCCRQLMDAEMVTNLGRTPVSE